MGDEEKRELAKSSLFPISREAIDQTLAEIEPNPDVTFLEEGEFLRVGNPILNYALQMNLKTSAQGSPSYIEGALWAHRIIRTQSKLHGSTIPKLTEEVYRAEISERIAKLKKIGRLTLGDYYLGQAKNIEKRDPEFGKIIHELTKYRPEKWTIVGGMVDTYEFITRADTTARLPAFQISKQ